MNSFLLRSLSALQMYLLMATVFTVTTVAASCPGFRLGTTSCNSGIFSRSSIRASCADDGEVAVTGTVRAPYDFDDAEVTFVPCIRSTGICFEDYAQSGGTVCDLIARTDGSDDCGTAGQYTISQEFSVPDEVSEHSWAMRLVTIKVLIDNEEACTQNATSTSSSAFMATGMASLFGVGIFGLYFVRQKRRPLLVLDADQYREGNNHDMYVHMVELSPSVSSIGLRGATTTEFA